MVREYIGWRDAAGFHVAAVDREGDLSSKRWFLHSTQWRSWADGAAIIGAALLSDERETADDIASLSGQMLGPDGTGLDPQNVWIATARNVASWVRARDTDQPVRSISTRPVTIGSVTGRGLVVTGSLSTPPERPRAGESTSLVLADRETVVSVTSKGRLRLGPRPLVEDPPDTVAARVATAVAAAFPVPTVPAIAAPQAGAAPRPVALPMSEPVISPPAMSTKSRAKQERRKAVKSTVVREKPVATRSEHTSAHPRQWIPYIGPDGTNELEKRFLAGGSVTQEDRKRIEASLDNYCRGAGGPKRAQGTGKLVQLRSGGRGKTFRTVGFVNGGLLVVAAVMQKQDDRAADKVYAYAQRCCDEWLSRSPTERQRGVEAGLAVHRPAPVAQTPAQGLVIG